MSSLRETLAQQRAPVSSAPSPDSEWAKIPALIVKTWRGDTWVLPWSHFGGAHLSKADGGEQLELSFANHHVSISGRDLEGLLGDLASYRLRCLKEVPNDFHSAGDLAPFIGGIVVQCMLPRLAAVTPEST